MSAITPWAIMAGGSLLANYFNPIPQPGQEGYTPTPTHHLRVMFENDLAFGHDRNYTHGTRIDYAREMPSGNAWGISLMQNIHTPEHHTDGAVPGEHPYIGYLMLGGAYMQRGEDFGSVFEFQVGASGNASGARHTQNEFHKFFGLETWDGWGDQVPSEILFQLSMRQDFRVSALEFEGTNGWKSDATFFLREDIGTAYIRGGAGISFRYGVNLPPSMQVTGSRGGNYGLGLLKKPEYRRDELSYFVVASLYAEYTARDITADGGVFHDFETGVSSQPWQLQAQLGVGVSYQGIDYYAGGVLQSSTYRDGETTYYGTFSVTWHW